MKLEDFLYKYRTKLNDLEKTFILNVFFRDFGELGLDYIEPQVRIEKPDGSGYWEIDFVIKTKRAKYAIECDGLYSHAEGAVDVEYFDNLQKKQNEIIHLDYKLIRFTNKMVREKPEECIWEIRRNVLADEILSNIYLNRVAGKIEPNEVQRIALDKLEKTREKGNTKGLVILATGLGKTYLSAFDVKKFNSRKTLFMVHINEILKQSQNSFQDVLPEKKNKMGFYNGISKEKDKDVLFASIQTLSRQPHLKNFKPDEFDYMIVDETHHTAAPSYRKLFSYFKPKFTLGLTATPERMDEQDILPFYGNNIVFEMNQQEAIERGYLVPFRYFGFRDNVDYSGIYFNGFKYDVQDLNKLLMIERRDKAIIERFRKYAVDKKTGKIRKSIGFCASVEHANYVTKAFRDAGFNAVAIHSKLDDPDIQIDEGDKEEMITKFRKGKYDIVFVVNMFNEGIDIPDVECLLFLRPTESKSVFIQQTGRGLRISPNKENVLILDFIGNYKTAGTILGGLGLKNGIKDLEKERVDEKIIYYYDNKGCRVEFDEEVVDIFRKLRANSNKKSDLSVIPQEWKDYGNYLAENTKEGVNLYWKIGKKNNHLEVHLWALDYISDKIGKVSSERVSTMLKNESRRKFPKQPMEGTRALFLSKILGLVEDSPLKLTEPFERIMSDKKVAASVLSDQLEKFYFWNGIFSLTDRHLGKDSRRPINKIFHIYPMFFIYDVIVSLREEYGYVKNYLSAFEIYSFLSLARTHSEIDEVVKRIITYRESDERYEIEKYLDEQNSMDSRFYGILNLCKYLNWSKSQISIKEECYDEVKRKVKEYRNLILQNKLIEFKESSSDEYYKMLYSKKGLLEYHR